MSIVKGSIYRGTYIWASYSVDITLNKYKEVFIMNMNIKALLETVNPVVLHKTCDGEPFKIMDIMTVEEVEASLSNYTHMGLMSLVEEVNAVLAN